LWTSSDAANQRSELPNSPALSFFGTFRRSLMRSHNDRDHILDVTISRVPDLSLSVVHSGPDIPERNSVNLLLAGAE
jgi:hypothetical protein